MRHVWLLACLGCGRLGFEPSDAARVVDTPDLPARLICSQRRFDLPPVAPNSDLAIRAFGDSHVAMWAGPGEPVTRVALREAALIAPAVELATGPVRGVAGLFRTANTTLLATATTTGNQLWSVSDSGIVALMGGDAREVARDPIVTDNTGSLRAWVRNDTSGIVVGYVDVDGMPATDRVIPTGFPVLAVAAADNADHTHVTWQQDTSAPTTECRQADLDLVPMAPMINGGGLVSLDCTRPRIDSGPDAKDAILTVWETSSGAVEMRYLGAVDDLSAQLSPSGRAPKIRFDGTRFWAVWIEEPSNVFRVAAIEEDATFETVDLPGWTAVGDEAFELTLSGPGEVDLVLLDSSSLTLLRTCI